MDKPSENRGFLGDKFSGQQVTPSPGLWEGVAAGVGSGPLAGAFALYETAPSPAVWDGVAAALHPNRKRAAIWWWSSAASILLLLAAGSILLTNESISSNHFVLNQPDVDPFHDRIPAMTSGELEDSDSSNTRVIDSEDDTIKEEVNRQKVEYENTFLANQETPERGAGTEIKNPLPASPDALQSDSENDALAILSEMTALKASLQQELPEAMLSYFPSAPLPPKSKSGEDDLYAMAGSFSPFVNQPELNNSQEDFTAFALNDNSDAEFGGNETPVVNLADDMYASSESTSDNSPPISFGLQFIALNHKRIHVGTGVEITTLGGKATTSFGQFRNVQQFSQQYIGIPLFGQIDVLRREKFNLYAKTGGVLDIGWRSQTQVDDYDGDELFNSYTYSFRPGNQVRMINSLGIRSSLTESLSLFIEGNGSILLYQSKTNLWSGRKIWPSMGVGLSVSF